MEGTENNTGMTFSGGMSVLPLDDPGASHMQNSISPVKKPGIKKLPFLVAGGFILIVIVVTTFVLLQNRVKKEDVVLSVEGPTSVKSGDPVTFSIHYTNNNPKVALSGSKLVLHAPAGFIFVSSDLAPSDKENISWDLGEIVPSTDQSIQVTGKFFGDVNTVLKTSADLTFTPQGSNTSLTAMGDYEPSVIPPSLTVDIDAPKTLSSGGRATYVIDVKNTADATYENLVLQIATPDGLSVEKTVPAPDTGTKDTWSFSTLPSGKSAHIEVTGILSGTTDEQKVFGLKVQNTSNKKNYLQIPASRVTVIAAPTISLTQTASEKNINAGDKVNFSLRVKNTGNAGFSNLTLNVQLDSTVLNPQSVAVQDGGVLRGTKIVWDNTVLEQLRSLEPNSEFTVSFTVASYKTLTPRAKNFSITATPSITIGSTVIPGAPTTVKILTELTATASASAFDSNKNPVGSGPTTPKVGQTTTYRTSWTVVNMYNEVQNGKITCTIPLGATYVKNAKVPDGTNVVFDEPTKTFIWNLSTLKAKSETETGSTLNGYFDVSVTPSAPDAGRLIALTSKCTLTGHDTYTDTDISSKIENLFSLEVAP